MRSSLALVLVVCLTLHCCSVSAQSYTDADPFPLISVVKKVSEPEIALGTSFDVEVTVTNMGQSPAFDIAIKDLLVNGTEKNKLLPSLGPKESTTLRYTVLPTALGEYDVGVTHVTYNLEMGNANTKATAISNLIREEEAYYFTDGPDDQRMRGKVDVLTPERYARLHRGRHLQIIVYLFLSLMPSLVPYIFFRMKRTEEDCPLPNLVRLSICIFRPLGCPSWHQERRNVNRGPAPSPPSLRLLNLPCPSWLDREKPRKDRSEPRQYLCQPVASKMNDVYLTLFCFCLCIFLSSFLLLIYFHFTKKIVRRRLSADSQEFVSHTFLDTLSWSRCDSFDSC
eukprot:gene6064-4363_t